MSKFLSAALIAVLTLSFVVTYAEENNPGGPFERLQPGFPKWSQERQENTEATATELQEKRDAWREEVAAKREAWRTATREDKIKFWNGAKRMLGERFTAALRNLERAQTRIGTLIDKLEGEGEDTDAAQALLDTSMDRLEDAKDKIEEIQALLPAAGEEVTPEIFEQIKVKAREAKDLIKESHRALVDSILELKGLLGVDDEEDDGDENEDEE